MEICQLTKNKRVQKMYFCLLDMELQGYYELGTAQRYFKLIENPDYQKRNPVMEEQLVNCLTLAITEA